MISSAPFATPRPPKEHDILDNANEANAYRVGDPNQPGYNTILNAANPRLYQDPALPFNQAVSVLPFGGFYKRVDRTLSNLYLPQRDQLHPKASTNRLHQVTALIGQEYRSVDRQTANNVGVGYQYNTGGTPFVNYLFSRN